MTVLGHAALVTQRLAVIGLDCGTPELMFDRYASDMPTLSALRSRSAWGPLCSTIPPITVPAWSCMLSGRTPGELGIYGFRNRIDHSYERMAIASSRTVRVPRLWDLVAEAGDDSILLGVPGTYPPPSVRGWIVSDFLAPSTNSCFTYPNELREEVFRITGDYLLDVANFRTDDKTRIAQQIFDMTEQRFSLARHLVTSRDWSLFVMVDMGPDRLHHGFWKYCDPGHPRHEAGNAYEHLFRDYYRALDCHLASLLEALGDDTTVLVVSDHGAKPMVGGFCFNEWLVREGLLVLAEQPSGPTPIAQAKIDWSRTTAWGDGGYYGRLFLNVEDREPQGTVSAHMYDTVRQQLTGALEALPDHRGRPMGTRVFRPEDVYPEVAGVPPDLIVYFGDLRWRAVGTLGLGDGLYTFENDTGPDDANHAELGVFALDCPGVTAGYRSDASIYDIAPTLQTLLKLPAPAGQRGRNLA
jgi:predicted AlkP superfamily phosphohydrolase/phosphomutase